ncbi:MAG: Hsp20/alpha crystallin family protein [Synergistaceae bacterium]|nr:Hsp20/alpha crystallin family protein [Synergistaceae bacterium]
MMKRNYLPAMFDRFMDTASLFDGFNDIADQMRAPFFDNGLAGLSARADVYRKDGKIFAEAELPGVKPEDVELHVYADRLTLSAEKKFESKDDGETGKNYVRSERSWGKVERVISFPVEVDPDTAKASFKHGVLTVEVTERAQDKAHKKVDIQVSEN